MLPITKDILTNSHNRPFLRDQNEYALRELRGIVAHWTANTGKGADAKSHVKYFNTTTRYASTHYIVDDHSIYQCIPDNEMGYHVGASNYKPDGERIKEGASSPNYFLIGFEMCVNSDGNWAKTYKNAVDLAAYLLRKYQFSTNDIYRHFDITGKDCPNMMLDAPKWSAFKNDIQVTMQDDPAVPIAQGMVTSSELNVRKGPGTNNPIVVKLKKGDSLEVFEESDGWWRIGAGRWVSKSFVQINFETLLGRIVSPTGANIRKGPGTQHVVVDVAPNGVFTDLIDMNGEWYATGSNRWVHKSLVQIVPTLMGTVTGTNSLNVRSGPGTEFKIIRKIASGNPLRIIGTQADWMQIGYSEWVFKNFVQV